MKKTLLLAVFTLGFAQLQAQTPLNLSEYYSRYHEIVSTQDNKVFDQSSANRNVYMSTFHGRNNQQWLVMPYTVSVNSSNQIVQSQDYIIASRANGQVLDISSKRNVYCNVYHDGPNQQFKLSQKGTQIFEVSNPLLYPNGVFDRTGSSKSRNPFDYPNQHGGNIYLGDRHGGANQQFRFRPSTFIANRFNTIRTKRTTETPKPRSPRSFNELMPKETPLTFVSEVIIPFSLVKNDLPISDQVQNSPYYRLVKSEYYKLPDDEDANKTFTTYPSNAELTVSIKTGITQTQSLEVARKLSISFNNAGEIGAGGDGLRLKTSSSIATALEITESVKKSYTESQEKTVVDKQIIPIKQKTRFVTYVKVTKYQLFRSYGSVALLSWDVGTKQTARVSYPESQGRTASSIAENKPTEDNSLLLNETGFANLELYPNPTTGIISLASTFSKSISVGVYDLNGSLVHTQELASYTTNSNERTIDISPLPAGLYLVRATNGFETITKRILKE